MRICTVLVDVPNKNEFRKLRDVIRIFHQNKAHASCEFDYLRMFDGDSTASTRIGTYCGTTLPPPGVTSGDKLHLYFHSDQYYEDVGFLMNWTDAATGDIPDDPSPEVSGSIFL